MTPPTGTTVGRVHGLWRYPVKSMQGETLAEAVLGPHGIVGDRAYALLDRESGGIASAKHPGKWAALARCRAAFVTPPHDAAPLPPVAITLPDGTTVRSDDTKIDALLSHALGRPVALIRVAEAGLLRETDRTPFDGDAPLIRQEPLGLAAPGTFFDVAALHLLTISTLERLRAFHPDGDFAMERFRPNIVVEPASSEQELAETAWIGSALCLGGCTVEIIDPTPRCVVVTLERGGLPRDPQILRTVAQHTAARSETLAPGVIFSGVVGVYARSLGRGALRVGEPVSASSGTHRENL